MKFWLDDLHIMIENNYKELTGDQITGGTKTVQYLYSLDIV